MRLVEACARTVTKLLFAVSPHCKSHPFSWLGWLNIDTIIVSSHRQRRGFQRSFDFSKFRNLQELDLRVSWMGGGLLWIPGALSTLKPATSPRLSTIQLSFARPFHSYARSAQLAIEAAGMISDWPRTSSFGSNVNSREG